MQSNLLIDTQANRLLKSESLFNGKHMQNYWFTNGDTESS